jgi:hypothetical protein
VAARLGIGAEALEDRLRPRTRGAVLFSVEATDLRLDSGETQCGLEVMLLDSGGKRRLVWTFEPLFAFDPAGRLIREESPEALLGRAESDLMSALEILDPGG